MRTVCALGLVLVNELHYVENVLLHNIMYIIVWPAIDLLARLNCVFLLHVKPLGNQSGTCIELFN